MPKRKNIADAKKHLYADLLDITSAVGIQTFNSVIVSSPFLTGRYRGNWQASVNKTIDTVKFGDVKSYKGKIFPYTKDVSSALKSATSLSDILYLTNNLPYADPLARGHSPQAKDGWIEQRLDEANSALKNKLSQAGDIG